MPRASGGISKVSRRRRGARVGVWQRPDVDVIDGLPPTISVGQSTGSGSLRSTLATTTEILDYLRLLFARCGEAHCPKCGRPLSARSPQELVEQILALEEGRKVMILAPLVRGKRGVHREVFETIAKAGFVRARVDGDLIEVSQLPTLAKAKSHTIEAIVDRIVVKVGLQARLRESVELAMKYGDGTVILCEQSAGGWEDHAYCSRFACAECGVSFDELEPRTFSFNSPHGRVPELSRSRRDCPRRERPRCDLRTAKRAARTLPRLLRLAAESVRARCSVSRHHAAAVARQNGE